MLRITAVVTTANFPINKIKYPIELIVDVRSTFDAIILNASLVA